MRRFVMAALVSGLASWAMQAAVAAPAPADSVYLHAHIYTVDRDHPSAEAMAVAGGRIVYVGSEGGARAYAGPATHVVDLGGRALVPGLVDGHLHPLQGGMHLVKCNLDYAPLTLQDFRSRIQACLDAQPGAGDDRWLEVVDWFRYDMVAKGVDATRTDLDSLKTRRPILVEDSFGHSSLANSRALALAKITARTPDPIGGRINHDAAGEPTGILEDAAQDIVGKFIPKPTAADSLTAARAALHALNAQGVTGFLDAMAEPEDLAAFSTLATRGELTIRAHFAPLIRPEEAQTQAGADAAVSRVVATARQYDQGRLRPEPSITVRNAKLFMDGVINAPANTGALLEPYRVNRGTVAAPHFEPDPKQHPGVYFQEPVLSQLLTALGRAGIDPHLHTDGDAAVRAALDAIATLRKELPRADIRPALAHCELVDPRDYARFAQLQAIPVLSMQWEKPAPDTIEGARDSLGPERQGRIEPAGVLYANGAPIAFGSDWPVDRLDEWFAFKVGVARTAAPESAQRYPGRLGSDPGLTRAAALHAMTLGAARELHEDEVTGSIQSGKFADFIVLDQDVFTVPAERIATTHVLLTVVGGRIVHAADAFKALPHQE